MSVGTDVGLDVFEMLALDTELDEEKPCEVPSHGKPYLRGSKFHGEGPGEWYMQFVCPHAGCGNSSPVVLVCDDWKQASLLEKGVWCEDCNQRCMPEDCFVVVERK